ncbi:MAG: hypothetical protein DMG11_18215 [Acidobacteria bacterium]|nr:MAG: hypothetical protein DMG11_18215 [Acidobacteriota bacterium]
MRNHKDTKFPAGQRISGEGIPLLGQEGGCAIKKKMRSDRSGADGVVRQARLRFAELTTPAAPSKVASRHFLMARPPLLSQEGNTLA